MSYVRSRVEQFENTSSKDQSSNAQSTGGRKKFLYPGRQRRSSSTVTRGGEPAAAATSRVSGARQTTFETECESELQEVWSVRRNVHHNSMATSNHMAISNEQSRGTHSYSRHNQSTQGHGGQHQDGSKDHNHNHQQQSVEPTARRLDTSRTPFYSSDTTPKRLNHSPTGDSPPSAKKKIDGPHHWMQQQSLAATPAETKVSYAKRMAQAHMKSVGIGNFTPHQDGYSQQSSGQGRVRWQKHDSTDDEFSF